MKYKYVYGYKYIPLWDTKIVFNETISGYYEKFIIGLANNEADDFILIPIIQSCGNEFNDSRSLLENDNTVDKEYYLELIKWINQKIIELNNNQIMFFDLIKELYKLLEWLSNEYDKVEKH